MQPTDKALGGRVSESLGRNAGEPTGGPDTISPGGRTFYGWVKAAACVADGLTRHIPPAGWEGQHGDKGMRSNGRNRPRPRQQWLE